MLPAVDAVTGSLPLGRFNVNMSDVKARYVDAPEWASSTSRVEIWSHFESATAELRRIVPTAWVWIGGSFISSKLDPDDIDVVYWCEDRLVDLVTNPTDKAILDLFARSQVRAATGLRVDARYCAWHVRPEAGVQNTIEHHTYTMQRGFWDDFWLRMRSGAKGDPPVRDDAFPLRGYLEVILDGPDVI